MYLSRKYGWPKLDDIAAELASASRAGKSAAVIGGGFCGLACAVEFAQLGYGVCLCTAEAEAGLAPASSAAAGLLDPLTPKGRLAWKAADAMAASLRLLQMASTAKPNGADSHIGQGQVYSQTGAMHVPRDAKHPASRFYRITSHEDGM